MPRELHIILNEIEATTAKTYGPLASPTRFYAKGEHISMAEALETICGALQALQHQLDSLHERI
jgi:hypothetical protein